MPKPSPFDGIKCSCCEQPAKHWAESGEMLCPDCMEGYIEEYSQDEINDMVALDECGRLPDGTCMKIGTEHCDWDCPYRDISKR